MSMQARTPIMSPLAPLNIDPVTGRLNVAFDASNCKFCFALPWYDQLALKPDTLNGSRMETQPTIQPDFKLGNASTIGMVFVGALIVIGLFK